MNNMQILFALIAMFCIIHTATAFAPVKFGTPAAPRSLLPRTQKTSLEAKQAKFGVFSPAVYAAKLTLGENKLNKIRGKAIALHSQAITEWCLQYGAYNLRVKLIKMAKTNGDVLGFLV